MSLFRHLAVQTFGGEDDAAPGPADNPGPQETLQATLEEDAYTLPAAEFLAGAAPTPADLAGLWLLREPYRFTMVMDAEGRWMSGGPSSPFAGRWTLAGDTLTRHLADDHPCRDESPGAYPAPWRAALAEDGSLHLEFAGTVNVCSPADDREVWDRAAPTTAMGELFRDSVPSLTWATAGSSLPTGLYYGADTGRMMDVMRSGRYRIHDPAATGFPVSDQGQMRYPEPEALRITCGAATVTGTLEAAILPAVEDAFWVYRISASGPACAAGLGGEETWVHVLPW